METNCKHLRIELNERGRKMKRQLNNFNEIKHETLHIIRSSLYLSHSQSSKLEQNNNNLYAKEAFKTTEKLPVEKVLHHSTQLRTTNKNNNN